MKIESRKQQTKQNMMRLGALIMAGIMVLSAIGATLYYIIAL